VLGNEKRTRVHKLLTLGADANVLYDDGSSIMRWAARAKDTRLMMDLLLAKGANAPYTNENGVSLESYLDKQLSMLTPASKEAGQVKAVKAMVG
jgi:hypothetical protein